MTTISNPQIRTAVQSICRKDEARPLNKEAAPRGTYLRKMLDRLADTHIGRLKPEVQTNLGLGMVPTGRDIIEEISSRVRMHDGEPTTMAKAVFSKAPIRKAVDNKLVTFEGKSVDPKMVNSMSSLLGDIAKTTRAQLKR